VNQPTHPSPATSKLTLAVADKLFSEAHYKNAAFAYRTIAQRSLPSEEVRARLLHRAAVSAFLAKEHRNALVDAESALSLPIKSEGLRRTLKGIAVMSLLQEDAPPPEPSSARLALAEGRFEDALTLARVLLSTGEDPNMRRVEGKALLALGDAKGALKALKRAAKAGPHLHLLLEIAQAAEEAGLRREATQAYQGVLRALAQPLTRGEEPLPADQSALGRFALDAMKRLQGR
jgi:tetratricopeptide (TPR) repeat protein